MLRKKWGRPPRFFFFLPPPGVHKSISREGGLMDRWTLWTCGEESRSFSSPRVHLSISPSVPLPVLLKFSSFPCIAGMRSNPRTLLVGILFFSLVWSIPGKVGRSRPAGFYFRAPRNASDTFFRGSLRVQQIVRRESISDF